jgi:UDP-N-acetylglucosamine 2-epimerase (non-hydrolysing)/GDP/UDP-N,N'-diacetylbacillosamine 2-epimerase (hydrolysing)
MARTNSAKRVVVGITGTRADYGLMVPVYRAIRASNDFELHLVVTGLHLLAEFETSLRQVRADALGQVHYVEMLDDDDSNRGMARSVGRATMGIAAVLAEIRPDILLLQGDRGEMLAGAVAGAHMNIPMVHMSGGDFSGTIDDSVRNAISKFSHVHLTNCQASTERLLTIGETRERIFEVGEPALDVIRELPLLSRADVAAKYQLPEGEPYFIATLHPVTDEVERAATQMQVVLEALSDVGISTVFTFPNTDAGGRAMRRVLESWSGVSFLRIEPNLGSHNYLSLMRYASAVIGNSSSGIVEAPSFKVPTINIGSRQTGRLRANNVIDTDFDRAEIVRSIQRSLSDSAYRDALANCINPYGDGHTAERTVDILRRLRITPGLTSKWKPSDGAVLLA